MAQFPTFPTQTTATADESVFAGTTAPVLRVSALPSYWNAQSSTYLEGFASSVGSAISLPITDTAALTCYSATGSTLWSKANPAAALATYDHWYGFWLNDDATLLYVSVVENSTTPNTFGLITIDVAGTVATLGTDTPASDFTTANDFWKLGSNMQPDGTGGFKLLNALATTTAQYAVIDAAGQFTTDPTALYANASAAFTSDPAVYETADGYLIGANTAAGGTATATLHNGTTVLIASIQEENLRGSGPVMGYTRWRDYVVTWYSAGTRTDSLKSSKTDMDTFAKSLATYVGIEL
jgi:hypothetical protein